MELLSLGTLSSLIQNTIYALPAVRCRLFTSDAAPTIQQSNSPTFANNVAVVLADGAAEVSAGFLRCTSGNITVTLKRA